MRGLIIKDCLTLVKQMKIFLVIIVIFSIVPGYNMSAFAIIYSALLPMTALAYDERSKWDVLAAMMPYRPRDIVVSKYLLGIGAVIAAAVISCIAQAVISAVRHTAMDPEFFAGSAIMLCGLIMLSVLLPFMFRFGVEKGRIAMFVIVGLAAVAAAFLSGRSDEGSAYYASMSSASVTATAGAVAAAAVVILIVSILISIRIYSKKEF